MTALITAAELLHEIQNNPDTIRIVDATYGTGFGGHDPYSAYQLGRIGDAVYFDIDDVADANNPLPHMAPSPEQFAAQVGAMGISNAHKVVVYDQTGIIMAACRVWWMFRLFGHQNVVVLDGGLPAWMAEGYPLTAGMPLMHPHQTYVPAYQRNLYATMADVEAVVETQSALIIDARPNQRFLAQAPEPRPNMASGHIPTSHNVPAMALVDRATGKMLPPDRLAELFGPLSLRPDSRVVTTCGSGVTACVDALALDLLGISDVAVYDGSWSEWSNGK